MDITANDEPTEIEADVDKRFSSIIVNLPVRQTGTGTPSPSNPRPFTMWTDVSLYVSDTEEADEPTLAIELPTPMYGGKIDMVRGEIATLYNSKESGTDWEMTEEGQFRCQVSAYNNGDETSTDVADLYAVHYETVSNKDAYDATDDLTCGLATIDGTTYLYVNDAQYTTLDSFATHIADEVFVFRAHIPMSDVTEPHIVYLPEGTSYVWADAGFVDYTVSGTPPLSLPNSLGKPLKAWEVDLLPYQEGTGDPAPDNVRPIHGTDKLTITTAGKNLFSIADVNYFINGVRFVSENNVISVTGTALSGHYPNQRWNFSTQLPAGQYTLSANETNRGDRLIRIWFSNNTFATINGALPYTFTAPADVVAFQYACNGGSTYDDVLSNIQLELGSTATPYTPYIAPSSSVLTLPQTVYTGTIGSDGGESRWAKKRITAFSGVWGATGNGYAVYVTVSGSIRTYDSVLAMCDKFKYSGNGYAFMPLYSWSGGSGVSETFTFVLPSTVTSLAEANQWIADNGGYIEFTYKLVTPTTFAVPSVTIPTPTGTATTWATAEDGTVESMEVTYVGKAT